MAFFCPEVWNDDVWANLGKHKPNLVSMPANEATASLMPPMWSGCMDMSGLNDLFSLQGSCTTALLQKENETVSKRNKTSKYWFKTRKKNSANEKLGNVSKDDQNRPRTGPKSEIEFYIGFPLSKLCPWNPCTALLPIREGHFSVLAYRKLAVVWEGKIGKYSYNCISTSYRITSIQYTDINSDQNSHTVSI